MKCGKQPRPQPPSKHNTTQHIADAANKQQKTRFSAHHQRRTIKMERTYKKA